MVEIIGVRDVGDTIRFETTVNTTTPFDDSESLTDPDSIEITIEDISESNTVINSQSMNQQSIGKYFYDWDTRGESPGGYKVTIEVVDTGNDAYETDCSRIRLKSC